MTFNKSIFIAASLSLVALGVAGAARAADCTKPSDCAKGFTCVILPIAVPVSTPACAKDVDGGCTFTDPTTPAPVTTPTEGQCELAPCTTESDCGTGMVCYTTTSSECTGGTTTVGVACPPGDPCAATPPPAPPTCTDTKTSMCAYKWQIPCNKDNDCGAGFTCTPTVSGECSGSAGGGTATTGVATAIDAGAAPASATAPASAPDPTTPVTPPSCTTTTSFPGYCTPKATTCKVDGDCPALWTCVAEPTGVGVANSGSASTGASSAGAASSEPNIPATGVVPTPTPTPSTMVCVAPEYAYTGDRTVGTAGGQTETSTPGTPSTSTGTGGAGGGSSNDQPGTAPTATNGGSSSAPSAGCVVGGSTPGSLFGLFGLAGVLGLALARRRR